MLKRLTKLIAAILPALGVLALISSIPVPGQTGPEVQPSDTASYYKAKCVACHGAKAEKKFDAALPEEQMVEAIMKGKKLEKPPHMPAYEPKGVNAEQAKCLITFMKQLKEAPAN